MTRHSIPARTAASHEPTLDALRREPGGADAVDAACALDALEVVLNARGQATDAERGNKMRDPNVAQDCLIGMGVPRHVARRVGSRDLRALYLGRYPPVRLTLGAAVVLHVAQRWAAIGTTPEQIFGRAHDAAHRVADLTPDRTLPTVSWD
jgi:hypothetical protein